MGPGLCCSLLCSGPASESWPRKEEKHSFVYFLKLSNNISADLLVVNNGAEKKNVFYSVGGGFREQLYFSTSELGSLPV